MKIKVDQDKCIGCALCVQACPEVFIMKGDKAVVYVAIAPKDIEDICKQTVDECPVAAIIIE